MKHPGWIHVIYLFQYIGQLRKWYLYPKIGNILKSLRSDFTMIDAGCAECQFLFPFTSIFRDATFIGIDKSQSNTDFCNAYIQKNELIHVNIINEKIEETEITTKADLIICIGVLQYIKDDNKALRSMLNMVKSGGEMLLYIPVNGKFFFPFFEKIMNKYTNYETAQNRQRIYSTEEILNKVVGEGFIVKEKVFTYGVFGRLGHELYNLPMIYILNTSLPKSLIAVIVLFILLPVILLCYLFDICIQKSTGNGLMIIAEKSK